MRTTFTMSIALLLAAALSQVAFANSAYADEKDSSVSWSVQPATADGEPNTQPWLELTLDPGTSVGEHLLITNHSSHDVQFALSAADGYFTDTGRFNMLQADQQSVDAGTWITLEESITVPADGSALVPFAVSVPSNATPGDHLAGVAAGILTRGDNVQVESRIGFRVMTRVTGDPAASVTTQVLTTYNPSWNPFLPGSIDVTHTITNTGNLRVNVTSDLTVAGVGGLAPTTSRIPTPTEIAPGEKSSTTVAIDGVWPLLATTSTVETVSTPVGAGGAPQRSAASATALALPWAQLVVLLLTAAVILVARMGRRRRRDDFKRQLEAARAQGRREGSQTMLAIAVAVGTLCSSALTFTSPAAFADDLSVVVEISPHSSAGPTPEPQKSEEQLPATGGGEPGPLLAIGLALLAVGGTCVIVIRHSCAQNPSLHGDV